VLKGDKGREGVGLEGIPGFWRKSLLHLIGKQKGSGREDLGHKERSNACLPHILWNWV
jgi:hypothetical protein